MILNFAVLVTLLVPTSRPAAPECWIRGDRSKLTTRASPHDSTLLALGGDTITVCYARPAKRGRPVMGELVPYGEPWRLGANEATAIHVPFRATIARVAVDSGWYSLYAVPGPREWRIVVNRDVQRWGIPIDDSVRTHDVGSGIVPVQAVKNTVEDLTITLRRTSPATAVMDIKWENTHLEVPIARRS
jgi:hypothetical protein